MIRIADSVSRWKPLGYLTWFDCNYSWRIPAWNKLQLNIAPLNMYLFETFWKCSESALKQHWIGGKSPGNILESDPNAERNWYNQLKPNLLWKCSERALKGHWKDTEVAKKLLLIGWRQNGQLPRVMSVISHVVSRFHLIDKLYHMKRLYARIPLELRERFQSARFPQPGGYAAPAAGCWIQTGFCNPQRYPIGDRSPNLTELPVYRISQPDDVGLYCGRNLIFEGCLTRLEG